MAVGWDPIRNNLPHLLHGLSFRFHPLLFPAITPLLQVLFPFPPMMPWSLSPLLPFIFPFFSVALHFLFHYQPLLLQSLGTCLLPFTLPSFPPISSLALGLLARAPLHPPPCDRLMSVPVRLLSSFFLSLHLLINPSNPLKLCPNNWGLSRLLFPQHKTKQILGGYSICKSRRMPRRRTFCFLSIPFSKCLIFFMRAVYFGLRKSILLGPVVSSLQIHTSLLFQWINLLHCSVIGMS